MCESTAAQKYQYKKTIGRHQRFLRLSAQLLLLLQRRPTRLTLSEISASPYNVPQFCTRHDNNCRSAGGMTTTTTRSFNYMQDSHLIGGKRGNAENDCCAECRAATTICYAVWKFCLLGLLLNACTNVFITLSSMLSYLPVVEIIVLTSDLRLKKKLLALTLRTRSPQLLPLLYGCTCTGKTTEHSWSLQLRRQIFLSLAPLFFLLSILNFGGRTMHRDCPCA